MEAVFPNAPPSDVRGRAVFEWMAGERFLIQRWEVPFPEAPDGVAIIGFDEGRDTLLQHYFDSRGVARVVRDELRPRGLEAVQELGRLLAASLLAALRGHVQRGRPDRRGALGDLERRSSWELDFDLIYTKVA